MLQDSLIHQQYPTFDILMNHVTLIINVSFHDMLLQLVTGT